MANFICKEVMLQIVEAEKVLQRIKTDIQLYNQKLKNKPGCGLDPKGPMSRILSSLEDCEFFFDQFLKAHGLKYLPLDEKDQQEQEASE